MIANEGLPSEKPVSPISEERRISEQAYRQKIVGRQCLNMLVDIKLALSRQNKMLEIFIDQLNAERIRNTANNQ